MNDEAEHRRLTVLALRMAGEIFGIIAVPISVLVLLARRLGAGKPVLLVAAILVSFVISTVTICFKAVKYHGQYLHHTSPHAQAPPPPPPPDDEKKKKTA